MVGGDVSGTWWYVMMITREVLCAAVIVEC
jgi:hypothetical protein